ncbi:hypothetical protein [Lactococcus allomyrinae]|uniref:Uncharacterized protein n=1 Tax=Lactococcus allomyrinae TaxID=2419773 RepID=A0A387BCX5_9LACT|nr:hypothetical protein [Lactococcus allomyrinae]AYF99881.1 hypothetical protein D7I46_01545 [Lactococcus allomyrinae]
MSMTLRIYSDDIIDEEEERTGELLYQEDIGYGAFYFLRNELSRALGWTNATEDIFENEWNKNYTQESFPIFERVMNLLDVEQKSDDIYIFYHFVAHTDVDGIWQPEECQKLKELLSPYFETNQLEKTEEWATLLEAFDTAVKYQRPLEN